MPRRMVWAVQSATHPQVCPVCSSTSNPGLVLALKPGRNAGAGLVPCPHCTDASELLRLLVVFCDQAA